MASFDVFNPLVFSPMSLSPALWLDAADQSTMYQERTGASATTLVSSDADPVGTWKDKSGNARHVTAASDAARPTYKTSQKNGRSTVLFDGVNDVLSSAAFTPSATNRWLFCVVNVPTIPKGVFVHGTSDADANMEFEVGKNYMYGDYGDFFGPYTENTGTLTENYHILGISWTRSGSISAATWYKDGVSFAAAVIGNTRTPNSNNLAASVGVRFTKFYTSHICELIYGFGSITSAQSAQLGRYLGNKWGITLS